MYTCVAEGEGEGAVQVSVCECAHACKHIENPTLMYAACGKTDTIKTDTIKTDTIKTD